MRADLPEVVEVCRENMPRLKKLTINTNGFATRRIMDLTERIVKFCNDYHILLGIRISLDGLGLDHDKIRGVPNGFDKCMATFDEMMALKEKSFFNFGLAYTINSFNVRKAEEMYEWCKEGEINLIFNVPRMSTAFLDNEHMASTVVLNEEDQAWVSDFFRRLVREGSVFNGDVFLYHNYVKQWDNGGLRTMDCPYRVQGIILNPFGELLYCEMSKEIGNLRDGDPADAYFARENLLYRLEIRENVCDTCLSPCMAAVNAAHQVYPYIQFAGEKLLDRVLNRRRKGESPDSKP
jgi:MoaA/NifB/PqqE/SkfB family radical SAM enzyme